ncbi:MAG: hypothetical protein ACLP2P_04590 [Desulfobaccales bacterium]
MYEHVNDWLIYKSDKFHVIYYSLSSVNFNRKKKIVDVLVKFTYNVEYQNEVIFNDTLTFPFVFNYNKWKWDVRPWKWDVEPINKYEVNHFHWNDLSGNDQLVRILSFIILEYQPNLIASTTLSPKFHEYSNLGNSSGNNECCSAALNS